jgi:hypothetical protein
LECCCWVDVGETPATVIAEFLRDYAIRYHVWLAPQELGYSRSDYLTLTIPISRC